MGVATRRSHRHRHKDRHSFVSDYIYLQATDNENQMAVLFCNSEESMRFLGYFII